MSAKHTAVPWFVFHQAGVLAIGAAGDPDRVVHWKGFDSSTAPTAEQLANAEFIVRACNSHAALLRACKAALPQLEWANLHGSRCEELLTGVKYAIAKAKGEGVT